MTEPTSPRGIPQRAQRAKAKRNRNRFLTATAAVVAVLVVCGIGVALWLNWSKLVPAETDAQSSGAHDAILSAVEVSGRVGATPVVTVIEPVDIIGTKRRVVTTGTGREITEGSPVLLSITAFDGADGKVLSPDGRPQLTVGRALPEDIGAELAQAVIGQTEGSRIVYVRQVAEGARANEAVSGIEIDVVDVLHSVARGTEVVMTNDPLEVIMGDEGPVIRHGDTVPTQLTVQHMLKGEGPQVRSDDRIVVQFTTVGWSDGVVRDSTWRTGLPMLVRLDQAMPGLRQAVVDQRVGSRLAISIPPDLATGDDTLCVVVDILGTEPAPQDAAQTDTSTPQSANN